MPDSDRRLSYLRVVALLVAFLSIAAACGASDSDGDAGAEAASSDVGDGEVETDSETADDDGEAAAGTAASRTIAVPGEYGTIQEAVDAASPGDLILIGPGVYEEAVNVTTDELVIRGLDRNEVILDGGFELDNGIRVLGARGVAIENMTARNYTVNGFFWTGVEGYRGSYLTAYRNGDYGVYAFDSVNGQLDYSYASGSPDAGFYIGQCFPCNAVIDNVVSEFNGLGYSGTNSGGNLLIVNSVWRNNRAGVVPNSGSYELCYPERQTTIVGNMVYSNNQPDTPAIDVAILAMGNGILTPGGYENVIARNRVWDHDKTGIGLVPFLEEDPNDNIPPDDALGRSCDETKNDPIPDPETIPATILWETHSTEVRENVVSDSRVADLAIGTVEGDPGELGNCWADNTFETSAPNNIEVVGACDGSGEGDWNDGPLNVLGWLGEEHPPPGDYKTTPEPGPQKNMPDAATAPARPATDVPFAVDVDAITVPDAPE
jgi:hypothetical protein